MQAGRTQGDNETRDTPRRTDTEECPQATRVQIDKTTRASKQAGEQSVRRAVRQRTRVAVALAVVVARGDACADCARNSTKNMKKLIEGHTRDRYVREKVAARAGNARKRIRRTGRGQRQVTPSKQSGRRKTARTGKNLRATQHLPAQRQHVQ